MLVFEYKRGRRRHWSRAQGERAEGKKSADKRCISLQKDVSFHKIERVISDLKMAVMRHRSVRHLPRAHTLRPPPPSVTRMKGEEGNRGSVKGRDEKRKRG